MTLEQSTPFRPFMRKLVSLTSVTGNTGKNNVVDIMPRASLSTTYGDGVFNLKNISSIHLRELRETAFSIITTIVLLLQFFLHLCSSKNARNSLLTSTTPLMIDNNFIRIILSIATMIISYLLRMSHIPSFVSSPGYIWMLFTVLPFMLSVMFTMFMIIQPCQMIDSFPIILMSVTLILPHLFSMFNIVFMAAFLTVSSETTFYIFVKPKVFSSSRFPLITFRAMLFPINDIAFMGFRTTFLANALQSILSIAFMKKLSRSGEKLTAWAGTLLLRDVLRFTTHRTKPPYRLATLLFLVARTVRCSISSGGLITPSLGNTPSIPFFQTACKAEGGVI